MGRRLIVNADDLGISVPRNEGIEEAIRRGIVTSVSVLANGEAFEDGMRRLRELRPRAGGRIGVGVHIDLSEGRPLAGRSATLAGPGGRFPGKAETRRRLLEGRADAREAFDEARAQMAAVLEAARALGLEVTHVDGHQHIHIYPGIAGAVAAAAASLGIRRVRLPDELPVPGLPIAPERRLDLEEYAPLLGPARDAFREAGIASTDSFAGVALMGSMTRDRLARTLDAIPGGWTELMVHPGRTGPGTPFQGPEREAELALLCDPSLPGLLAAKGIDLASWGDLPAGAAP